MQIAQPRTRASEPALTSFCLAAQRSTDKNCSQTKNPSRDRRLTVAAAVRTLVNMISSHERPTLGALLFSVLRFEPASTDNCRLSAERCGDCFRSRVVVVLVFQRIDRYSYSCLYCAVCTSCCCQLYLYLIRDRCCNIALYKESDSKSDNLKLGIRS